MARLSLAAAGESALGDPSVVPQLALAYLVERAVGSNGSLGGRDMGEVMTALQGQDPIRQILDLRLRAGPYGDLFGARPDGLSLGVLSENPHGVDFGPLEPRLPNGLRTKSGMVELAPAEIVGEVSRLRETLDRLPVDMVLIGRRQLRSNNSWMHNFPTMMRGSNRCTLLVNPEDARRFGLAEGDEASVTSRVGTIKAPVEISDEVMPGVASLPHGWVTESRACA